MSPGSCNLFAVAWPGGPLGEGPGRKESVSDVQAFPSVSILFACCLLILSVPRPGPGAFMLLGTRTPIAASDTAS